MVFFFSFLTALVIVIDYGVVTIVRFVNVVFFFFPKIIFKVIVNYVQLQIAFVMDMLLLDEY